MHHQEQKRGDKAYYKRNVKDGIALSEVEIHREGKRHRDDKEHIYNAHYRALFEIAAEGTPEIRPEKHGAAAGDVS